MKIYNEVVIDMNPESSTFEETLYEDSYEYEGDMALCARNQWQDSGWSLTDVNGDVWTSRLFINRWGSVGEQTISKNGEVVQTNTSNTKRAGAKSKFDDYIANYAVSGKDGSDTEGVALAEGQIGDFSYTAGEFDPTSSEFRKSVSEEGGFGEIAAGYGMDAGDFDEFYGAPLKKVKEDYTTGKQALGLRTGKSLGDIYGQIEGAQVESGFESSGAIDYTKTKAAKGVMGDYLTQQQELSSQLASSTEDFWKTTEDQFYAELGENTAAG